jgi:hypothetical protein
MVILRKVEKQLSLSYLQFQADEYGSETLAWACFGQQGRDLIPSGYGGI